MNIVNCTVQRSVSLRLFVKKNLTAKQIKKKTKKLSDAADDGWSKDVVIVSHDTRAMHPLQGNNIMSPNSFGKIQVNHISYWLQYNLHNAYGKPKINKSSLHVLNKIQQSDVATKTISSRHLLNYF